MLIPYLMKVSLILAVLTLAYRWLIQFETFSKLNRVLLWLNVAAAWTLPLITLPDWGPVKMQTEFHHSIPKIVGKVPVLEQPLSTIQSTSLKTTAVAGLPGMTVADWLLVIYLSGVLVMAIYLFFQVSRLFVVIAKGRAEHRADGTSIVYIPGSSPYSFFKWIIVDPARHSDLELHNILAHEAEHVLQWHSADLLLAEIQRICLWFNPFSWVHQRLAQENLEYLADKAVLNNGFEKKQYQYNLLNAALRTPELPLTNSFAQSLLKKRIKMMNRKPSHYLVWGKYIAVLALVYISSAFVAPYREQLVEMAPPGIKSIVQPLIGEVIKNTRIKGDTVELPVKKQIAPNIRQVPEPMTLADTTQQTTSKQRPAKGVLIVGKTLFWAITPLTTWNDINAIIDEVEKFGTTFEIGKIQFDPLQHYITAISVRIKTKDGFGTGEESSDSEFEPMKGYSGYVSGQGHGMGQLPPASLSKDMEEDYQKALAISRENEVAYFEYKLGKSFGSHSASSYTRALLTGPSAEKFYIKQGIGKSSDNTLKISEYHKNATFYLNTKPSTFTELNELSLSKVERVSVLEDNARRRYFIVYAH